MEEEEEEEEEEKIGKCHIECAALCWRETGGEKIIEGHRSQDLGHRIPGYGTQTMVYTWYPFTAEWTGVWEYRKSHPNFSTPLGNRTRTQGQKELGLHEMGEETSKAGRIVVETVVADNR